MTGCKLRFNRISKSYKGKTASLDRIDSSKGYTIDNIWWIHKFANDTKWDLSLERYIYLCKLLKNPIVDDGNNESCLLYKRRKNYHGYGNIELSHWNSIINKAKKRKININITIKDAWNKFLEQNGKCALTGLQLWFPQHWGERRLASLDRIDNKRGYTIDNVQWVHCDINRGMKKYFSQKALYRIAKVVIRNIK